RLIAFKTVEEDRLELRTLRLRKSERRLEQVISLHTARSCTGEQDISSPRVPPQTPARFLSRHRSEDVGVDSDGHDDARHAKRQRIGPRNEDGRRMTSDDTRDARLPGDISGVAPVEGGYDRHPTLRQGDRSRKTVM